MDSAILTHEPTDKPEVREVSEILDHTTAIRKVLDAATHPEARRAGVTSTEIEAVGHRVVHGGESFKQLRAR